jgi:hypothetical protein
MQTRIEFLLLLGSVDVAICGTHSAELLSNLK